MKKIGILFGQENSFPQAFVDRINEKGEKNISAEFVRIDKMMQGEPLGYSVIVDRISQDVPFYRASLKNAAITGTAVINNPFWWSADEKFFNNALAVKLGVPVPKTVLLPSKDHPDSTTDRSFRNLAFPLDWDAIFDYVGFPAYMKPFDGGGWRDVYKISDKEDLWAKFAETKQLVMLLQEEIIFDDYFRCYCIGGKHVRIMQYEPRNPHHLRYEHGKAPASKQMLDTITKYVLQLNQYLGYDFNTVEFAVRDGIPYAIDFCNPAPDAEVTSVGQDNFEWVVETAANYAIERAKAQRDDRDNLTWGEYVKTGANGKPLIAAAKAAKADDVSVGAVDHAITDEAKPKKKAAAPKKEPAAKKEAAPKKAAKK
ncbi:RimK family alpha-L-glutamate ligase [Mucilaginibacter sp.]|uniref:ATP-grasp domain-containing protein n=1 Tax=Mucilaginibacter sp. TaxID=1882438 RepID=UPI0035BC46C9